MPRVGTHGDGTENACDLHSVTGLDVVHKFLKAAQIHCVRGLSFRNLLCMQPNTRRCKCLRSKKGRGGHELHKHLLEQGNRHMVKGHTSPTKETIKHKYKVQK